MRETHSLLDLGEAPLVPKGSEAFAFAPTQPEAELPEDLPDNFVLQAMDKAYDPNLHMVRDVRYDDSSLATAKNIYDFCANLIGSKVKMPFARQLWMMMHVFGEYCPRCSPATAQILESVPVDADPHDLHSMFTWLEYGRCPRCHATKRDLTYLGELRDTHEFVLVGGQRMGKCLEKGTLILTENGLLPVEALCEGNEGGWAAYSGPRIVLENGKKVLPSRSYVAKPEPLYRVTLSNGMSLAGTGDHPIWTLDGWVALRDLEEGTPVPIRVGQSVFPKAQVSLASINEAAEERFAIHSNMVQTSRHDYSWSFQKRKLDVALARTLGFYVAEGHCDSWNAREVRTVTVSNNDPNILSEVQATLASLYPDITVHLTERNRTGFSNIKAAIHFDLLLGTNLRAKSAQKIVPPLILQSPQDVQRGFLQALYEGDGGVNMVHVEYTTISRTLAQQVQTMLANFGVPSRLKEGSSWATNGSDAQVAKPTFTVRITGNRHIELFQEHIGFLSERKKDAVQALLDRAQQRTKQNPYKDESIPEHRAIQWADLNARIREEVETLIQEGYRVTDSSGRVTTNMRLNWLAGANRTGPDRFCNLTLGVVQKSWDRIRASSVWPHLSKDVRIELEGLVEAVQDPFTQITHVTCVRVEPPAVTYDIEVPEYHRFMANGMLSHNSTITSIMCAYILHKYAKSPKLSTVAKGIQDFSPLTGTFVALTSTNAIKLLWKPFREIIVASEWFNEYFGLLDRYGKEAGRELFQFNPTGNYLRLFTKNLDLYPEGPNKRSLRGPTRFMAAVDELGHFPYDPNTAEDSGEAEDERERANAEEVHTVLTNSLSTVRTEVYNLYNRDVYAYPQGISLLISSPASWQDKIMRLYRDAEHSTTTFAVRAPTWEVSPIYSRDHPVIANLYRTQPKKAERDFGANPPKLDSTVFSKANIQSLFCLEQTHVIMYSYTEELTKAKAQQVRQPSAMIPPSILALDAGLKNNAFALSVQFQDGPLIKVPVALEAVAQKGTKVDFVYIYHNAIAPIIKAWNVKEVYADRWNSEFILRQIEEDFPGVIARNYSLRSKDFEAFIQYVATGQLLLPRSEVEFDYAEAITDFKTDLLKYPGAHLYRQFLTAQHIAGMLVKGNGSTDDMLRAVVLGVTRLFDLKVVERMKEHKATMRAAGAPGSVAVFSGRSAVAGSRASIQNALLYGNRNPNSSGNS